MQGRSINLIGDDVDDERHVRREEGVISPPRSTGVSKPKRVSSRPSVKLYPRTLAVVAGCW